MARSSDLLDTFEGADWRSASMGVAFANEHSAFVSEGNSGKISILDWNAGRRRVIDLNQGDYEDSYSGDLAADPERNLLYVADQANFRIAVADAHSRQVIGSVRVGRLPFAVALSPDRHKLYVTNLGMLDYKMIPGGDPKQPKPTGLPFPAFGFPSAESLAGTERQSERGAVKVPGVGDPNTNESNSVAVVDISHPAAPKVEEFVRTGLALGDASEGGSSPSGIVAAGDKVYVSNAANDSITVIDAKTNRVEVEIPIRIPGMEGLRGVLPIGLAYHEASGWLLVAEAGINAVGVIDVKNRRVLGHVPAAWFPTRVSIDHDTVFVASAKGHGTGPSAPGTIYGMVPPSQLRQGSLSIFPLPKAEDLAAQTEFVMEANGFHATPGEPAALPSAIRHVVLIVKEGRTYDEVLGDAPGAAGLPALARLGAAGYVDGKGQRFSFKDVNITPNQHAMARRWAFSDNFYADSEVTVDGHHWLAGVYPNAWTESSLAAAYSDQRKDFRLGSAPGRLIFPGADASLHPEELMEAGSLWHHLKRHGVSFANFGEGFELAGTGEGRGLEPTGARYLTNVPMPEPLYENTSRAYPGFNLNIPDQYRASQFIQEIEDKYVKSGQELPQFLFVQLPNDHLAAERPDEGYFYGESFAVDNDYALGRIVEYLSGTKWWKETAVLVTEADAQGGVDHVDAHRTLLLCAGPYCRKNYVSHVNSSFPGLLKTIFRLLHLPPLTLFDAAAADLGDMFTPQADVAPYKAIEADKRLFDPGAARTEGR